MVLPSSCWTVCLVMPGLASLPVRRKIWSPDGLHQLCCKKCWLVFSFPAGLLLIWELSGSDPRLVDKHFASTSVILLVSKMKMSVLPAEVQLTYSIMFISGVRYSDSLFLPTMLHKSVLTLCLQRPEFSGAWGHANRAPEASTHFHIL